MLPLNNYIINIPEGKRPLVTKADGNICPAKFSVSMRRKADNKIYKRFFCSKAECLDILNQIKLKKIVNTHQFMMYNYNKVL